MPVDRDKIAALRQARMLTMEEAATRAGMTTRQQWYGIESGQRSNLSADTLHAVAKALGVTMDSLMVQDEEPQPKVKAKRRPK